MAQRLFPRDKSCSKLGRGRGRTSESGERQRPGLGLRNSGLDLQIRFQTSSEKQLGRSVYENSTWGYWGGNAKLCWGFNNSSDTVVRYGERWLFCNAAHLHQEPQLLSGNHLLKLPHPSQVPPVPYSPSHLPAFALPRLPAPQAFVCLLTSNPDSLQPGCVGVFALLEVYGIQIFKTQALPSRGLKSPQNEKKQMYNR